jgi:hypothetical protein
MVVKSINPREFVTSRVTFRRVFPLAFFLMIFALGVRQSAYIDPDLWWHLQTGQEIAVSKVIPHTDIFSFTKAGSEWVTHEWLSELLVYGIYRLSGWGGLLFIFSAVITLALYLCYRDCEGKPYVAAIAILLAAVASAPLFGIRPQMITFLLASIFITLLRRYSQNGASRPLWLMVPLMLLWVNLHAGYALGLALIGLFFISQALDQEWLSLRPLLLVLIACTAVIPLNPNGFRMFSYPVETLTSPAMAALINEWASPDFHQITYLPLALLLFTLLSGFALSPRKPRLGELFLLLITGFAALRSVRHIPIFALIAAPVIAEHAWAIVTERGLEKRLVAPEAKAGIAALVFALLFPMAPASLVAVQVHHFATRQPEYEAKNYPRAAVDFLIAKQLPAPIYNRYGWGGYLIRRLYPDYRVFIDGRADVYGDAFMIEHTKTYDGQTRWREPLDRLSINTVLISPDAPLASLLRDDDAWNRVYEDSQAVIFTKKKADLALAARANPTTPAAVP